jgi:methylmalonyl-CoA/ethylmalonyl-CoA epimerase
MIKKIDHIGIAVKDFESSLDMYKTVYGLDAIRIETHEDIKVKIALIPLGDILIELLHPTEPDGGTIGQFLKEKGEGFHHIAMRVENIDYTMQKLKEKNIVFRDKEPRAGSDESRIAFIDPAFTQNVLTELVERKREVKTG